MASQDWLEKDFYQILGVSEDVGDAELKKTYRGLARKYHPDSNPGDTNAEAKFKEISEAFSVLSDREQRAEYDQIRAMRSGGARFTSGGPGGQGFEDILGGLFGGAGGGRYTFRQGDADGYQDLFSMFEGAARPPQQGPRRGSDIASSVTIDLEDAVRGVTVTLRTSRGQVPVKIPAGIDHGKKVRVRGKGEPSVNGGQAGDLMLTVQVRKHPVFTREGQHLRVKLPVTFTEATFGAVVEVPTLDRGTVKLKIPAGTPSGRVFRLKGRGVSTAKVAGDLLVEVQVVVPTRLSDEARVALEAFRQAMPDEHPRADLMAQARG